MIFEKQAKKGDCVKSVRSTQWEKGKSEESEKMKFRAKMDSTGTILQLANLASVVSRLCQKVVMRITRDKVYLIQPTTTTSDGHVGLT